MAAKKKTDSPPTEGGPTYAAASGELEQILASIEDGSADIDELSERVERAAELIKLCRAKLERTDLRVREVVEELQREVAGQDDDEE